MEKNDIKRIAKTIAKHLPTFIEEAKDSVDLHNKLCKHLILKAKSFGYQGISKYSHGHRKVDVIWADSFGQIKLAIAIDGGLRVRSIKSLKDIKANNKLWIFYGNPKKLKQFLEKNDPMGTISTINLNHARKIIREAQ